MTPYKSKSGKKSGVTGFQIGEDYIIVQFDDARKYKYSYDTEKKSTIEKMKSLAMAQKGLSTFISRNNPEFIVLQARDH
ncbi:MAG: hypothetical protein JWP81_3911 [Ferruginibacter sp.]|nr:hypothetical protein [Ferruginibacter sp.]